MAWDSTAITTLLLEAKDLSIKLGLVICQKLDLGQPIYQDVDFQYLLQNIIFALTYATTDTYVDKNYSYLAEMISEIKVQRSKYRVV